MTKNSPGDALLLILQRLLPQTRGLNAPLPRYQPNALCQSGTWTTSTVFSCVAPEIADGHMEPSGWALDLSGAHRLHPEVTHQHGASRTQPGAVLTRTLRQAPNCTLSAPARESFVEAKKCMKQEAREIGNKIWKVPSSDLTGQEDIKSEASALLCLSPTHPPPPRFAHAWKPKSSGLSSAVGPDRTLSPPLLSCLSSPAETCPQRPAPAVWSWYPHDPNIPTAAKRPGQWQLEPRATGPA